MKIPRLSPVEIMQILERPAFKIPELSARELEECVVDGKHVEEAWGLVKDEIEWRQVN